MDRKSVNKLLIGLGIAALVLFGYDYYQVRTQALCAHANIINMGAHP